MKRHERKEEILAFRSARWAAYILFSFSPIRFCPNVILATMATGQAPQNGMLLVSGLPLYYNQVFRQPANVRIIRVWNQRMFGIHMIP